MTRSTTMTKTTFRQRAAALFAAVATASAALLAGSAFAADSTAHTVRPGWGEWWLPYNYAKHGGAIDSMFTFIFWLTTIVLILVQVALVYFLIKYRNRGDKNKAKFIHGNTRLEMVWTLIPAVILAVLALASKHIWDRYRYAEDYRTASDLPEEEVLVIGEQFQWNFVYPGADHKLGQYLAYPHPSDPKFRGMPYDKAMVAINKAIIENPLGQNVDMDEAGKDDDYDPAPGRALILPANTPVAIKLSSKDVIHDFFLPNFRVKLDALPGMAGRIGFTCMPEGQSTEDLKIDDPKLVGKQIWVDSNTPNAVRIDSDTVSQINYALNVTDKAGNKVQIKSRTDSLTPELIYALKQANVQNVSAITKPYELVCEELCGQGHTKMRGVVIFVSNAQYQDFMKKPPVHVAAGPTTNPSVASTK